MNRIRMIFLRYIFLFFLFACVLVILFIPVYRYISGITLETELININQRLKNGITIFDSAIRNLNNTVVFTKADSRFRVLKYNPASIRGNPFLQNELQRTFGNMFLSQSLVADAGIIFSDDVIITRQGIFITPGYYSFFNEYLQCGNMTSDEWKKFLVSNKPILPVMSYQSKDFGSYDALTFTAQWYFSDGPGQNILYATLPVKNLIPLVMDNDNMDRSCINIFDNQKNLIMKYSGASYNQNEKFHVFTAWSETIPIYFELSIPEAVINGRMRPVTNMILLFAMISVGFIILLSLFFAYKSSEPMRHLLIKINTTKNIRIEFEGNNEYGKRGFFKNLNRIYTDLGESISVVDARLETTLQTIEQQTRLLKGQTFDRALHRGIYGEDELQEFMTIFPEFPDKFHLALIHYDIPANNKIEETAALQLQLISMINKWNNSVFTHATENAIALLLPVTDETGNWHGLLETLCGELIKSVDYNLYFSLSNISYKPADLPKLWRQLQFIHSVPGLGDQQNMKKIRDTTGESAGHPVNIGLSQMIYNALCSGNESTACAILDECIVSLPPNEDNLLFTLVYNMLHDTIILLKLENPSLLQDIVIPRYEIGNEDFLFHKQFPACFGEIAQKFMSIKEFGAGSFNHKVLDYINKHLYNPGLYSTMVLDYFRISQPTLQKLMKGITGKTFLVYVETRRLEKAMAMLSEGGYSIQDISASCGFSKTDSFYKAFKRTYGFPPSNILHVQ